MTDDADEELEPVEYIVSTVEVVRLLEVDGTFTTRVRGTDSSGEPLKAFEALGLLSVAQGFYYRFLYGATEPDYEQEDEGEDD